MSNPSFQEELSHRVGGFSKGDPRVRILSSSPSSSFKPVTLGIGAMLASLQIH